MSEHYTDSHLVQRGSSVDLIERCAAFIRQCGDFEGILEYGEDEESIAKLHDLTKAAMKIIAKESR